MTEDLTREELLRRVNELEKKTATLKEANGDLILQLQAKDAELVKVKRELEQRIAEGIHRNNDMQKNRDQYHSLVGNIPGAVYRCANDAYWTMEFISAQIEVLTGFPASDFIRNSVRSYNSVIHPEDVIKVVDAVNRGIKHKKPYTIEYRLRHKNGTIIPVYERGAGAYAENGDLLWLDGVIFAKNMNASEE